MLRGSAETVPAQILARQDYVVPGIPVFFVVPSGSVYKERFLNEDAFRL